MTLKRGRDQQVWLPVTSRGVSTLPFVQCKRTETSMLETICEVMGCKQHARWRRPLTLKTAVEENLCMEHFSQLLRTSPKIAYQFDLIPATCLSYEVERIPAGCKDAA